MHLAWFVAVFCLEKSKYLLIEAQSWVPAGMHTMNLHNPTD